MCSHRSGDLERPIWKTAHRTSAGTGRKTWIWTGCKHASAENRSLLITSDPERIAEIEANWAKAIPDLLALKTAGWTDSAKAEFTRRLTDRPYDLPESGTLELAHSEPAQHEQRNHEEHE